MNVTTYFFVISVIVLVKQPGNKRSLSHTKKTLHLSVNPCRVFFAILPLTRDLFLFKMSILLPCFHLFVIQIDCPACDFTHLFFISAHFACSCWLNMRRSRKISIKSSSALPFLFTSDDPAGYMMRCRN